MQSKGLKSNDGMLANFRYRKKWKRATSVLSIFVVIGTISSLMLPAITLNQYICGQDEHTHGADCYSAAAEPVLSCDGDSLGLHRHTSPCCDAEGNLICDQVDFVVHTHDSGCFDSNGALVCSLKEVSEHSHDESCYQATEVMTDEGHSHSDSCYEMVTSETPTCGTEESSGHKHGETCYATGTELICTETESSGHIHSPECNGEDGSVICGLEESTGHTHEASCYLEAGSLMCTTPESDGHQHSEECFGLVRGGLICTEEEREPVIEQGEPELICEKEEVILHSHEEDCYSHDDQGSRVELLCQKPEILEHQHGETCFAQQEVTTLICTIPEHTHTEECEPLAGLSEEEQAQVDALIVQIDALPTALDVQIQLDAFNLAQDISGRDDYLRSLIVQATPVFAQYDELTENQKTAVVNAATLIGLRTLLDTNIPSVMTEEEQEQVEELIAAIDVLPDPDVVRNMLGMPSIEDDMPIGDLSDNTALQSDDGCRVEDSYDGFVSGKNEKDQSTEPDISEPEASSDMVNLTDGDIDLVRTAVKAVADRYDAMTFYQKAAVTNYSKLEMLMQLLFPSTQTLAVTTAGDIPVDFYVYDAASGEWELVAENQMVAHYSTESGKRDYITVADVHTILKDYGFKTDVENVEKTIAYRTYRTEADAASANLQSNNWYSDTTLNTQVPAAANGTNVIPLSVFAGHGYPKSQGYAIAFLPGNTKRISNVPLEALAEYCGLDKRENGTHTGMTMTLFNYGSKMSAYADKLGFFYGAGADVMKATSMDEVKGSGIGSAALKMQPTLSPGGWPTGTYNGYTVDTAYLFAPDHNDYTYEQYMQNRSGYVAGTNPTSFTRFSVPITGDGGLFYKDGNGYLIYDSAVNAATYNGNGGFTLYDHSIAPKHVQSMDTKYSTAVQCGNFLPFNDATQINPDSYQTLNHDKKPQLGYSGTEVKNYCLSENTDLWFGMTMEVDFYMPKNGQVNGQPMIFDFFGDDDVWVYIDDVLVLDIGGVHGSLGGSINFATGEVDNPAPYLGTDSAGNAMYGTKGAGYGGSMLDANGNALTNLKDIFANAGKDTSTFNNNTFGNYTKHKLKFFYMERGGNISYCRLKFNLPTLPANSLTVGKDIEFVDDKGVGFDVTPEAEAFAKQNLQYTFRVLKEDGTPLIKNASVRLVDDFGNQLTGMVTVDSEGYFTLRADQKVRFDNMMQYGEGDFRYYVEESIPNNYTLQYGGISYGDGGLIKGVVNDETHFTTYRTAEMKPDESNFVVYTNKVISEKMSFLKISKEALPGSDIHGGERFPFRVTIGDAIVDEGTEFVDVNDPNTVLYANAEGVIYLELGQTVMLNNPIIAGTQFRVEELETEGWQLDHITGTFLNGATVATSQDGTAVADLMPVNTTATVTAYNKTYAFGTELPLSKQFRGANAQLTDFSRFATFSIEQVKDAAGTPLDEETLRVPSVIPDVTLECLGQNVTTGSITIGYLSTAEKKDYYYRIVEISSSADPKENFINDASVYVFQITVTEGAANITAVYKDGVEIGANATAAFVNTLAIVELPATGGIGTTPYTFSGWAIILTACALMYNSKRKNRKGAR